MKVAAEGAGSTVASANAVGSICTTLPSEGRTSTQTPQPTTVAARSHSTPRLNQIPGADLVRGGRSPFPTKLPDPIPPDLAFMAASPHAGPRAPAARPFAFSSTGDPNFGSRGRANPG